MYKYLKYFNLPVTIVATKSDKISKNKIEKAKKTILYACIGLIISALAFIIVNFVINNILGQAQTTEEVEETSPTSLIELPIAFSEK